MAFALWGRSSWDFVNTADNSIKLHTREIKLMRDRHNDILDLSRRELMAYAGAAALTAGSRDARQCPG